MSTRDDLILALGRDPVLAHKVLFQHRHPNESPPFHADMIRGWHSDTPRLLLMAFRGGAKSTLSEEGVILTACYENFHNCLILGENEARAVERLRSIKHEFETNPFISDLFGIGPGPTWAETRIVLSNGICIQAHGRNQSLRGVKHLDHRPDLLVCDDIEDEEAVSTPAARAKVMKWFMSVVLPSLAPKSKVRMNATPLDPEALAVMFSNDASWETRIYPKKFRDEEGAWSSTWPSRFTIEEIDEDEKTNMRMGTHTEWVRENMCQAVSERDRTFTRDMLRTEPVLRTWHAVQAFYDPARTVKQTSAHTGKVVWSWIGNRLVVWESAGRLWKPDEMIDDMFATDTRFNPIAIGVEEDGLHEFIMQPLRHAQTRRAQPLPIRAMKAPKGKHDFIRSLQPFFKAHEVVFVGEHPELTEQLLSFPTGRIDVPNALAYALRMRPGAPIYDGFSMDHIAETLLHAPREPLWLVLNATGAVTSGQLVQVVGGALHVLGDWLREGDPGQVLGDIVAACGLEAQRTFRVVAAPAHFGAYDTSGLLAAARKIPVKVERGAAIAYGREEIRAMLSKLRHGQPALRVASGATWSLRALAGGYCRELDKRGIVSEFASDGPYRVLMEGLESFAALLKSGVAQGDDLEKNYSYTPEGRRYLSARV